MLRSFFSCLCPTLVRARVSAVGDLAETAVFVFVPLWRAWGGGPGVLGLFAGKLQTSCFIAQFVGGWDS